MGVRWGMHHFLSWRVWIRHKVSKFQLFWNLLFESKWGNCAALQNSFFFQLGNWWCSRLILVVLGYCAPWPFHHEIAFSPWLALIFFSFLLHCTPNFSVCSHSFLQELFFFPSVVMHTCLFSQESKDSLLHMQVVGCLVVFLFGWFSVVVLVSFVCFKEDKSLKAVWKVGTSKPLAFLELNYF